MRLAVISRALGCAFLVIAAAAGAAAQPPKPGDTPPEGRRIEAGDGDTVVVYDDAHVRVVRRSNAIVRAIHDREQRWLVLLIDRVDPQTRKADGVVDEIYRFIGLDGAWPLGDRWDGRAVLDTYAPVSGPAGGLGVSAAGAFVQIFPAIPAQSAAHWYADPRATRVTVRDGGHTSFTPAAPPLSFANAEQTAVDDIVREAASLRAQSASQAPAVRVDSTLASPRKIKDVKPTMPASARQAGAHGVVILEITIGLDGTVTDARILRSTPLLDQAALDAVYQWRYEPPLVKGVPVPVIVVVTVAFP